MQNSVFAPRKSVPHSKDWHIPPFNFLNPDQEMMILLRCGCRSTFLHVFADMFSTCRIPSEHFERSPIKYRVACNGMSSNQVDAYFPEMWRCPALHFKRKSFKYGVPWKDMLDSWFSCVISISDQERMKLPMRSARISGCLRAGFDLGSSAVLFASGTMLLASWTLLLASSEDY